MNDSTSPSSSSLSYSDAGVDIAAAESALDASKVAIRKTHGERVLADVGSFGGLFNAKGLGENPVLVATADGVGTKIRIAAAVKKFDSVGRCLVQHCINDALVQGAEPMFFLDYIGTGKLDPEMVATAVTGVAKACGDHNVALLGGETAEMPGVYPDDEFDLVGTLVGIVEREHIIDGSRVEIGDKLIGLPSVGLHTNGYSLARRIVEERMQISYTDTFPGDTRTAADVLLDPHLCYLESLRPYLKNPAIHALAHITGGGVPGNLPRVLNGHGAAVSRTAVPAQNVFTQLCEYGKVEHDESWKAFNMGVGMIIVVSSAEAESIYQDLDARGEKPFMMGEIRDCQGVEWLD